MEFWVREAVAERVWLLGGSEDDFRRVRGKTMGRRKKKGRKWTSFGVFILFESLRNLMINPSWLLFNFLIFILSFINPSFINKGKKLVFILNIIYFQKNFIFSYYHTAITMNSIKITIFNLKTVQFIKNNSQICIPNSFMCPN